MAAALRVHRPDCDRVPRVRRMHVLISGFTQHHGQRCGIFKLHLRLGAAVRDAETTVDWFPWNANWRHVADQIWLSGENGTPPEVFVYAYSYGAGWGALCLADELSARDIPVRHAVFCDAVKRTAVRVCGARLTVPGWRWLALTSCPRIVCSPTFRRVDWFYQRSNLPAGHVVIPANPDATQVTPGRRLFCEHQFADDHEDFHAHALRVAGGEA